MKTIFCAFLVFCFCQSAFAGYTLLLKDDRYPARPFTVELPDSNEVGIASLESYFVKGKVVLDERGNPEIGVVNGLLVHSSRSVKHDWSFALDPKDLAFADNTIELCDGQFTDIENDPDYWFNTVGQFCPWSTRSLVQEIRKNGKIIFKR